MRALAPRAEIREGGTDDHAAWLEQVLAEPDVAAPARVGDAHEHDHRGDHLVDSVSIEAGAVLDLEELEQQLAALPASYVRVKGIVRASDGRAGDPAPRWISIHRVGLRVSSEPVAAPAGWTSGEIVALGPGVDASVLAGCVVASEMS